MLIDSNIIIYAMQSEHAALRAFIAEHAPAVSAISYVEVLGYHKLIEQERALLEAFFAAAPLLPLSQTVLDQAVKLRQLRKMTLGDALIAGTALAHQLTLVTRNTADFAWIAGLTLLNPSHERGLLASCFGSRHGAGPYLWRKDQILSPVPPRRAWGEA